MTGDYEAPGTGVALRERDERPATAAVWVPSFATAIDEAVARVDAKNDFFRRVMREDLHYGKIPGTGKKPTLLKPGAELLLSNMGLYAEFEDADTPTRDYGEEGREGLIMYRRRCCIYRQPGEVRIKIAQAEGSCSSREEKYRWRSSGRVCPDCGLDTILKSKFGRGNKPPGWYCFKKKGGCGNEFDADDPRISAEEVGRVLNSNLADVDNTVLKMADKRALVAATLIATGCSDIFTQDMEAAVASNDDLPPPDDYGYEPPREATRRTEPRRSAPQPAPAAEQLPPALEPAFAAWSAETGGTYPDFRALYAGRGLTTAAIGDLVAAYVTAKRAEEAAQDASATKGRSRPAPESVPEPERVTLHKRLMAVAGELQMTDDERHALSREVVGKDSTRDYEPDDYRAMVGYLENIRDMNVRDRAEPAQEALL